MYSPPRPPAAATAQIAVRCPAVDCVATRGAWALPLRRCARDGCHGSYLWIHLLLQIDDLNLQQTHTHTQHGAFANTRPASIFLSTRALRHARCRKPLREKCSDDACVWRARHEQRARSSAVRAPSASSGGGKYGLPTDSLCAVHSFAEGRDWHSTETDAGGAQSNDTSWRAEVSHRRTYRMPTWSIYSIRSAHAPHVP